MKNKLTGLPVIVATLDDYKQSDFQMLRQTTKRMKRLIQASASASPEQLADLASAELATVDTDLRGIRNAVVRKSLLRFKRELKRLAAGKRQNSKK